MKGLLFKVLYIVFLVFVLTELLIRSYLCIKKDIPFFIPANKLYYYIYPCFKNLERSHCGADDFNVLVLGGSAIQFVFNSTSALFEEKLKGIYPNKKINIFNCAQSGHTSLDSLYKYQNAKKYPFDLVIYYHAINDVRANNIEDSFFKDDYSHYVYYKFVNNFYESKLMKNQPFLSPFFIQKGLVMLDIFLIHPDMFTPKFD